MRPGLFKLVVLFIAGRLCMMNVHAQDWPQYLGPERNSTSPQKGIIRSWPEKGPEVLWTARLGNGYGGPVVRDGMIYLLDRDDSEGDRMRCLDLSSGRELWNFGYRAPGSVTYPGSRSVPVVDGDYVYSCGPYGDLYCIGINSHKPVWNKNVWTDFGGDDVPNYGITQCPLVYGDLLILASQAPGAGVVAYNKFTGVLKWKTPPLGKVGYVSPAIVKIDGKDHIVMITASGRGGVRDGNIVGIAPLTGRIMWEYTGWDCHTPVPSAVDAGNNKVLVTGGYELGSLMIKVDKKPDGNYGVTELFRTLEFGAHTKPPILYKGYFYAQYSTNYRRDGLVCMNMDGKIMWKTKRDPAFDKGSMILADGLILATDGRQILYVIDPDPAGFNPLSSAVLPGGASQDWAPLALADGKLLVRFQSMMLCVKVAE